MAVQQGGKVKGQVPRVRMGILQLFPNAVAQKGCLGILRQQGQTIPVQALVFITLQFFPKDAYLPGIGPFKPRCIQQGSGLT